MKSRKRNSRFDLYALAALSGTCCLLAMVSVGSAYQPVDDLIGTVGQLTTEGQITDHVASANLTTSLQTIGTLIDSGETLTAASLLTTFKEQVGALSGVAMTADAAGRLTTGAEAIGSGL
jgi:hypothetical protein